MKGDTSISDQPEVTGAGPEDGAGWDKLRSGLVPLPGAPPPVPAEGSSLVHTDGESQRVSESDRLKLESVPCKLSVSDTSSQPLIHTLFLT